VTIKDQLNAINAGIKEVSIEPRKDWLLLVATLPAKVVAANRTSTHPHRI
jgi:hypothetical protein